MDYFNAVESSFEISNHLFTKSTIEKYNLPVQSYDRIIEIKNYGYYILFFSQLELFIDEQYEKFIGKYDEDSKFLNRVSKLYSHEEDPTAELIKKYCNIRNDLAHGRIEPNLKINFVKFIDDIKKIASEEIAPYIDSYFEWNE